MGWLVLIAVIGTAVAIMVARDNARRKQLAAALREQEAARLALKIQAAVDKLESVKTTAAKVNNCQKVLSLLDQAGSSPECVAMITNYGEVVDRLRSIEKVLRAVDHVEKAYKHQFKGNAAAEKNALLDALYEIRTKRVTNRDFDIAMVMPEGTGEIIRIENIQNRLKELGWSDAVEGRQV